MIRVRKLIWDSWNIAHIARHHIIPDEVESLCHGMPLVLRGQKKNRLLLVGQTEESRILTVILEPQGNGIYYPITAYESDTQDIALYMRLKGGDDNEENK